jgi:AcrR family transcriptional regulator
MTNSSPGILGASPSADKGAKRKTHSRGRLLAAARTLFVKKGYHAARPQDIARLAGTGHGTFYLHFTDKRACFLAFVEDARTELSAFVQTRVADAKGLEHLIEAVLAAIYAYTEDHPGVLATAMTDDVVIASEGPERQPPLLQRWGEQWADIVLAHAKQEGLHISKDEAAVFGQAVVGAIHQASSNAHRAGLSQPKTIRALTRFLMRGLRG